MEEIVIFLFVVGCIAAIGHGIWVAVRAFLRFLFGSADARPTRPGGPPDREALCAGCGMRLPPLAQQCPSCGLDRASPQARELTDLAGVQRQLDAFLQRQELASATADEMRRCVLARRNVLLGKSAAGTAPALEPAAELSPLQSLERLLGTHRDPGSLAPEDQERALAWYREVPETSLGEMPLSLQTALARLLETAGDREGSLRTYRRLLDRFPTSPAAPEAALEAGCIAVQAQRWDEATAFLEHARSATLSPRTRQQAKDLLQLCRPSAPSVAELPAPPTETLPAVPEPPARPRRSLGEVLAAFMEERNIFWGELLGGLLMVGCSIALVISLWNTLEQIPYFPFLVFSALTAALYGAGWYTLHHWKLASTSRGLLVISTLLVPLNLLILAGLSRGSMGGWLEVVTEVVALAGFVALLRGSERVLLPDARGLLGVVVVGSAATQLLVPRLSGFGQPLALSLPLLGALAVVCHGLGTGCYLRRLARIGPLRWPEAKGLFLFLGMGTFALAVALGFLVHWSGDVGVALGRMAVLVALAGVPVLAAGLLLQRRLADEPALAAVRTAATGVALAGMLALLAGVALAWPEPGTLVLVCGLDFAVVTVVAFALELPVAHGVALPCLALGYVTAFLWLTGHLAVSREELAARLVEAATSRGGGSVLVPLALFLSAAGELCLRWGKRVHGIAYALGGGAVALASLAFVTADGLLDPGRVAAVAGVYTIGVLHANLRWRKRLLDYVGLVLLAFTTAWVLQWAWAGQWDRWALAFAAEALALGVLASAAGTVPALGALPRACRDMALAVGGLTVVGGVVAAFFPSGPLLTPAAVVLAVTAFVLAREYRWPALTLAGSLLVLGGIGYALFWHLPELSRPRLVLAALLGHATFALLTGLGVRRARLSDGDRLFSRPLLATALFSSACALPALLTALAAGPMLPLALAAGCLAAVWGVLAWDERQPVLFAGAQAVLGLGAALAALVRVEQQPWFPGLADGMFDPRAYLMVGIGLGVLSLLWVLVRIGLRSNATAQALLEPPWPSVDRSVLALLVLAQLGSALAAVFPDAVRELVPAQLLSPEGEHWLLLRVHATGTEAWLQVGLLLVTLLATLWERRQMEAVAGLILLAVTVPILAAGGFREQLATASALRWGFAACFLICSVVFWTRTPLLRVGRRVRWSDVGSAGSAGGMAALLVLLTVVPVLVLTFFPVVQALNGVLPAGPEAASFFGRIGPVASVGVPVVLIGLGFAGHAARERSPVHAFAAGLSANVLASLIVCNLYQAVPVVQWWVPLVQVNAAVAAVMGLGWLLLTPTRSVSEETPSLTLRVGQELLALQVALGVFGGGVVVLAALGQLLLYPAGPLPLQVIQSGQLLGWLAALLAAAGAVWYVGRHVPERSVHVWSGAGLMLGVLLACTAARWDRGDWLAHHVLTSCWSLAGLALLAVGWAGADLRLVGPVFWDAERRARSAEWLAARFPLAAVRRWVEAVGVLVLFLALRGVWSDPARPYAAVAATLTVSALFGALALWARRPLYVYVSGLLVNVAGYLVWQAWLVDQMGVVAVLPWGPGVLDRFLYVNVLCLAASSALWSVLEMVLRTRTPSVDLRGRRLPFSHAAALAALNLLVLLIGGGLASDWTAMGIHVAGPLAWASLAATAVALLPNLWDPDARFAPGALYAAGLLALGLVLHGLELSPRQLAWAVALLLAGYVLLTSVIAWLAPRGVRFWWAVGLPEAPHGWSEAGFLLTQAAGAALVVGLGVWIALDFGTAAQRLAGPLAVLLLLPAGVLLTGAVSTPRENGLRHVTLALGVVLVALAGWALLDAPGPALWLHRGVVLLTAVGLMALLYGAGLARYLPAESGWAGCARRMAPVLGLLACLVLSAVLVQEFRSFDPVVRRTPMALWAVIAMALTQAGLIAAGLTFAVQPERDPFGLSDRGRTAYVYAGELLLALFFVHLRLNLPRLMPPVGPVWPFAAMAVAFLGVGLSEYFNRKQLRVLAVPLQQTGIFLPLLPLLAFWARPPAALHAFADERLPGLRPLLDYLDRLPQNFGSYALLWFGLGVLYTILAASRGSFRFALAAALAGNFGLWALLHHGGVSFLVHPQLWLIPLALIVLAAEHHDRDRLPAHQAAALRYAALLLLYQSSTADLFVAGLGSSVVLPVVLAVLAVAGVLAGILLQVRAFLFTGFAFLVLDVFTMIWHAAVDRTQTWVWWVSGIVLGAAILALFAVFEKKREEVLRVIEQVKQWD